MNANQKDVERFGKLLKQMRKDAGLTQAALAFEAGIGRRTIQQIEAGTQALTINLFFSIARALHIQPKDFFEGFEIDMEE